MLGGIRLGLTSVLLMMIAIMEVEGQYRANVFEVLFVIYPARNKVREGVPVIEIDVEDVRSGVFQRLPGDHEPNEGKTPSS